MNPTEEFMENRSRLLDEVYQYLLDKRKKRLSGEADNACENVNGYSRQEMDRIYEKRNQPKGHRIYLLIDPRNGNIRYVGQTYYATQKKTFIDYRPNNFRLCEWVSELEKCKLKPIREIICICEKDQVNQVEGDMIKALINNGIDLLNIVHNHRGLNP